MNIKFAFLLRLTILFTILLSVCSINTAAPVTKNSLPVKVIIDTDLDSDVDDVGALAMLYNLHNAGKIELLGVIVTSNDPYAPVCAAALNTWYGVPELPVGFLKNQPELKHHSRYTKQISEEFPSALNSWKDTEDAVKLYRSILAKQADESVVVVTVGHLSSLQGLLRSEADDVSLLNGLELAHKKASKWICMGGHYPQGKEANFYRPDPASTVYCVSNWTKEIIFCGWEAGNKIITGGEKLKEKLVQGHPVYRGYELYNGFAGRQSWDQIAVLQLIRTGEKLFSSIRGKCIVAPDGSNTWENIPDGPHSYVVLNSGTATKSVKKLIDGLMAGERAMLKKE